MIYLDRTAQEIADEHHFKLENLFCVWHCGETMRPAAIRTKDEIGILQECSCGAWQADLRPVTKEAIDFWNTIV